LAALRELIRRLSVARVWLLPHAKKQNREAPVVEDIQGLATIVVDCGIKVHEALGTGCSNPYTKPSSHRGLLMSDDVLEDFLAQKYPKREAAV
jgi:hypothetical protein